ncbi:MAG: ABC transporter ATP-binding protein [Kiloniellaceae bacterium]
MSEILRVKNLRIGFDLPEGRLPAVRGVSFRVRRGSTVAIVGESGAGKTVVSQAIMGILPKTARIETGEILFFDPDSAGPTEAGLNQSFDIAALDPNGAAMRAIRGGRMSIIFQEPMTSLSPVHTVGNQITEALHLHRKVSAREGRELTVEMLRLVGFPDPFAALKIYPFELSGGLRQRAMIAMALICRPALLIADEPTTALDVTIQAQILKLLKDLQAELGMAILMITHDLGVVANVAEEIVVMHDGEVMESGTLGDIFRDPKHPYLKALLHAVPRFNMAPGERLQPIRDIQHATGGQLLAEKRPWPESQYAAALLTVEGVTKRFSTRKGSVFAAKNRARVLAAEDVGFEIRRGECLGLVGESGCGKTTVAKIIMRALTPDAGRITFNDRGRQIDVLGLTGEALIEFRRRIQYMFQDPFSSLNPRMTAFEIISEPLVIHRIGNPDSRAEMVKELMRAVGLDIRHLKRYPHSFSGGQRQRIGIARTLALRPDLVICDEPVSALDVSIQAQILNLLKDLKAELGLTYFFISHNLAVIDYIADRIAVMCRGRLVELAPCETLFDAPAHPYTRALLSAVPEPDPDHRLDLSALMEGRTSDPAAWPAPFTVDGRKRLAMVELDKDHFVYADPSMAALEAAK